MLLSLFLKVIMFSTVDAWGLNVWSEQNRQTVLKEYIYEIYCNSGIDESVESSEKRIRINQVEYTRFP